MYSLQEYVQSAEHIYLTNQGIVLARLVSLSDDHVLNQNLWFCDIPSGVSASCNSPIDDVLINHLMCVKALHMQNYVEAFNHQSLLLNLVCKMLGAQRGSNWMLPVMYTVCLDLRMVAQKADATTQSHGGILEKAAENLLVCFRICIADSSEGNSKKSGLLNPVNHLLRIYFKIDKYHLCQSMIRVVEPTVNNTGFFSIAQQVTFKFFVGRLAVLQANFTAADKHLSFAFKNCHALSLKNKRMILTYLLPVKMLLGYMPSKQLVEKYNLPILWHLMTAVKDGKLKEFEDIVQQNRRFFDSLGLLIALDDLRIITYRNVLKKVYHATGSHKVPIANFQAGLQVVLQTTVTASETQNLIAKMIFNRKIKAYMSYQREMVLFSSTDAFPRLSKMHYSG